jgi:hypothetical protein
VVSIQVHSDFVGRRDASVPGIEDSVGADQVNQSHSLQIRVTFRAGNLNQGEDDASFREVLV